MKEGLLLLKVYVYARICGFGPGVCVRRCGDHILLSCIFLNGCVHITAAVVPVVVFKHGLSIP